MAAITKEEVHSFINQLFSGQFNDLSDFIKDQLECGYMHKFRRECQDIYDIQDNAHYVIVAAFELKRWNIVLYYIQNAKDKFNEALFRYKIDLNDALDFCENNGISFDYYIITIDCCVNGNLCLLKHIIENKGYELNKNEDHLELAIVEHSFEVVKYLINEVGVDITHTDRFGRTYLHMAVIRFLKCVIKLLIDAGVDRDKKDNNGRTAADLVEREDIKQILREYHPMPDVKEPDW